MIRALIGAVAVLSVILLANVIGAAVTLGLGKAALYSFDRAGDSVILWVCVELAAIACSWGFIVWVAKRG